MKTPFIPGDTPSRDPGPAVDRIELVMAGLLLGYWTFLDLAGGHWLTALPTALLVTALVLVRVLRAGDRP